MESLFIWLSNAIEGTAGMAMFAALGWGIISILLSPCHLTSIPLIVGFLGSQSNMTTRRAFVLSAVFSFGIFLTIALVGMVTAALGRMMGDVGPWGNYFVAIVFVGVGLYLFDLIKMPWSGGGISAAPTRRGVVAAFVLGLIFGIAVGPCTFAYMAPVLAVTFSAATTKPLFAYSLLLLFGVGHCSVIVLAGTFVEKVQLYLNWTETGKAAKIMKRLCGAILILAGITMCTKAL